MNRSETGNGAAWFALVVAVIALIIGWVAFNRSGQDLEAIIEREVDEATIEIQTDFQELEQDLRNNASQELEEASDDVSTDGDPENVGE